jgi:SHS2 domain-containing protein
MPYRFLDHTADVGAEVTAPSLDALFAEALGAFTDTVTERDRVGTAVLQEFELAAPEVETLLVDWLGELVYSFEVGRRLFHDAECRLTAADGGQALVAVARGEAYDPARHPLKVLVKGITYHGLRVSCRGGEWSARVIFDI